jgi:hypothetical protein
MDSDRDTLAGGLPHSEIPGSTIARISPGLIAACHALHRLSVPRHPPDALKTLDPRHDISTRRQSRRTKPATHRDKNRAPQATLLREDTLPQRQVNSSQPSAIGCQLRTETPASVTLSSPVKEHCRQCRRIAGKRCASTIVLRGHLMMPPSPLAVTALPLSGTIASRCYAMVEVNGIEPMTSCLQSRRSPN